MNALVPLSLMRPAEARFGWTDEAIETLKRLCGEGFSASQIALEIGITSRSAVIGKASRLGINLHGKKTSAAPRIERRPSPLRPTSPGARVGLGVRARSEKRARLIERDVPAPEFIGITVVDLSETSCRWPHGDPSDLDTFRYCGAPAEAERPYCPHHCGMAYVGTAAAYAKSTERNQWLMKA